MRTVTMVGAVLATAAVSLTAAALPQDQERTSRSDKPPVEHKPRTEERTIRRQLGVFGSREAQIGVSIRDLDADTAAAATGAVVERVAPDSPAERAGIKAGDVITGFDGEKVRSARQLARLVNETPPGRTVPAAVLRDGKSVDLKITPEAGEMAHAGEGFVMPPMAAWRAASSRRERRRSATSATSLPRSPSWTRRSAWAAWPASPPARTPPSSEWPCPRSSSSRPSVSLHRCSRIPSWRRRPRHRTS